MPEVGRDAQVARRDKRSGLRFAQGIDVELEIVFEEPAEALEDSALQVRVILLLENLPQRRHAHDDADHLLRVPEEIRGESVILAVVRDEHVLAQRAEDVHAVEKILRVNAVALDEVLQRHLHQHGDFLALHLRLLHEEAGGALEHVQRGLRDGSKTAALDHDGFFVEHVRGLHDLAAGQEHRRLRQPALHELERHHAIVHARERRAGELDHVHLHAFRREVVEQRVEQRRRVVVQVERAVDEVHTDDAQRLLLLHVLRVQQPRVDDDLRRLALRLRLEPHAQPAVRLHVLPRGIAARRHGVRKGEELRVRAALLAEPLDEQGELALQHGGEPLPADVALARAVNRVAHRHVVG